MWVILVGNPIEGFNVYGPFGSDTDAKYYCDNILSDELEGWIFQMTMPDWASHVVSPNESKPSSNHN